MLESTFPRISSWLSRGICRWRLSTWWPSDSRPAMQQSLLRLLTVAHAEQLDPLPLVANLAEEHRGSYRRRLRRFARRLREGTPWVEALEQTPDVLRDDQVLAIRFATQTGTLPATLDHLIESDNSVFNRNQARLRQTTFYVLISLIILAVALAFLAIAILPLFKEIHGTFEMADEKPWTFHWLIATIDNLVNYAPLWIAGVIVVACLVWSAPARRLFRRSLATRWVRGVALSRRAEMMHLLSISLEAGRPLPAAISTMARYHFDTTFRQKLLYARNEIEQGADVWESLSNARLLSRAESAALARSSSQRSRVWTLRKLAACNQQSRDRRGESVVTFAQPALTLVVAVIVLWIASSVFGFLSQIIHMLAAIH